MRDAGLWLLFAVMFIVAGCVTKTVEKSVGIFGVGPELRIEVYEVEQKSESCMSLMWNVVATNPEDRYVDLRVMAVFTPDSGEVIEPKELSFILRPGQERKIDGPPVLTRKLFTEMKVEARMTGKTYVKPPP